MEIERPKARPEIPENAKKVFEGVIFDVYQWEQEMFDGSKAVFEKLKRPDTVIVLPVLPDGKIMLVEEEQPGKQLFLGAPGGRVEKDEDPVTAAKRELLEEAGYEAEEFILWKAEQPVGKIDWVVYNFIAKGVKKVSGPNPDPGEKITPKMVTFEEFVELGSSEKFTEKGITSELLRAKLDPVKMAELKRIFSLRAEK